jgi:hypothetical protein
LIAKNVRLGLNFPNDLLPLVCHWLCSASAAHLAVIAWRSYMKLETLALSTSGKLVQNARRTVDITGITCARA